MANGVGDERKSLSKTEMHAELSASCRDASNGLAASHAGKSKWKRWQRRRKEKQHKEAGNGITAAIPADVVGDVLKLMNPKEAVRMSSVCRYWLAPALACDPSLRPTPWKLALTQSDYYLHFRLQSAADASVFVKIRPVRVFPCAVTCLGSWQGWLVLRRRSPREELSLLNPFSRIRLSLPPAPGLRDVLCVTSDPATPGCAVIARDYKSNLLIWRPGDRSWTAEAVEGGLGESCPAVWLKEQLFLLDLSNKRLLSLQLNPPRCKDLKVKFSIDMLDPSGERRFLCNTSYYMVESQGDLLAFDVGCGIYDFGTGNWQKIEAFRLDWNAMAFVREASLGGADRAVFLGGGGEAISVSAQEAGCAAGCIYFADSYHCSNSWSGFSWHCCNFKDGSVTSVSNLHLARFPRNRGQFWITPTMKKKLIM